jgi:hypothetical protein
MNGEEKYDSRPKFMHGTNEGRVQVPTKGPGTISNKDGAGKAQIENQNLLCLAMEQDRNEGGYNGR